jgi:uncharacterized membrane-anchored protein
MSASARSPEAAGHDGFSKVANVTLAFWLIKICATTVGETGGDAFSMTLNLGYAVSTLIFLAFFLVALAVQLAAKRFHPAIFWTVVVATTTVGTTTSDYLDRTAGLGYVRASILLFCGVILVLIAWRRTTGSIGVDHITSRRNEAFYWLTILISNTLGTALGDFTADSLGLGFEIGALVFAGLIALVAVAYLFRLFSSSILFWAAYVLTRPLGATLGDTLTKPHAQGGLDLGRFASSGVIVAVMIALIVLTERRQARADPPPADASAI